MAFNDSKWRHKMTDIVCPGQRPEYKVLSVNIQNIPTLTYGHLCLINKQMEHTTHKRGRKKFYYMVFGLNLD